MAARRRSIVLNLIRCGETAWGTSGRLHGRTDLPLSAAGRAAVAAEIERFRRRRIGTVCHAPDEAATDTAMLLADACGARTKAVAELADPDLGVLEGLTAEQFAERYPTRSKRWQADPFAVTAPEGESIAGARRRILGAIARQIRRSRGREIGVVLHGLGVGFVRAWAARRSSGDFWPLLERRSTVERYLIPLDLVPGLAGGESESDRG